MSNKLTGGRSKRFGRAALLLSPCSPSPATDKVALTNESDSSGLRNERISEPSARSWRGGSQLSSLAESNYGGKQYKWALPDNEMLARVSHRAFNRP